ARTHCRSMRVRLLISRGLPLMPMIRRSSPGPFILCISAGTAPPSMTAPFLLFCSGIFLPEPEWTSFRVTADREVAKPSHPRFLHYHRSAQSLHSRGIFIDIRDTKIIHDPLVRAPPFSHTPSGCRFSLEVAGLYQVEIGKTGRGGEGPSEEPGIECPCP